MKTFYLKSFIVLFFISISLFVKAQDAELSRLISPDSVVANGNQLIAVEIINRGTSPIVTMTVGFEINTIVQTPVQWTGTIMPYDTTFLILGSYIFTSGYYNITAYCTAAGDTLPYNDTLNAMSRSVPTIDARMELIYGLPDTINNINSQNISVLIINDGFNPIYNLPISYKSNNNSAVTETWTGTLATNDTASFIFTTPFTPSIGNNDIKAYTSLSGDLNPLNDTAYHKLVVHQVFDASISAIISPNNTINNFLSQSVAVMVKNYGTSIISNFPISYQVNGNPPIVEACTLSIMPGDSALFTFNSSFMPTSINLIRAYSSLAGDQVSNNDTAYKTVIVIPGSSIGGTVFAGVYPIDFGIAYLYALDTINNSLILNDSAIIDTLGHYDFHNIMAGTYIVKSLLTSNAALYGQYITTYYGDAMFWTNATQINLASTNVWGADINLIPVVPLWPGTGNISGTVVNSGIKSSVEGVEILLLNDNNQIVAVEYSDASGFYKFSLIPLNSYTVYPEVTGLKSYSQIIVLDSTNQNITGLDISIGSMNVIVGLDGEANKPIVKNINVYPNPMQERINIQFALTKYSEINFQIFNQAGQLIKSHNSNKGAGEHIQQFELIELPQGVYFLQIIADGQTIHKKFIKLK